MKIATVLSLSALLAMFSAVACSSPTTPDGGDKSDSAASGDDDDDKDTKAPKSSTPASNTPASNTSAGGDTDTNTGTAAEQACDTCLDKNAAYKAVLDCADAATDDTAETKCFTDAGCTEGATDSVCAKAEQACETECKAADADAEKAEEAQEAKCISCLSSNAQAKAQETCFSTADSDADAAKCGKLKCDSSCEAAYGKCQTECPFLDDGGDE